MTILTFAFIGSWNALLWPLLVVNTDEWRPVAYGLTKFVQTDSSDEFHWQMAASVIMILPILAVYFFAQKQFTEGIWAGSFKG
jgi:ABC-type glycerol-3-phosphate transport system permease component